MVGVVCWVVGVDRMVDEGLCAWVNCWVDDPDICRVVDVVGVVCWVVGVDRMVDEVICA